MPLYIPGCQTVLLWLEDYLRGLFSFLRSTGFHVRTGPSQLACNERVNERFRSQPTEAETVRCPRG